MSLTCHTELTYSRQNKVVFLQEMKTALPSTGTIDLVQIHAKRNGFFILMFSILTLQPQL